MRTKNEKKLIVFIDCGDTLIDESTQVVTQDNIVERADMIEGAKEMLYTLHESGYRIALVADGNVQSFTNMLKQHGVISLFETLTISETLDCEKPDPRMFKTTMERMGLIEEDTGRIVMIGNNIKRDIVGANRLGICSVLLLFSPRYNMQPESPEEQPCYAVKLPAELPELLERLEQRLQNELPLGGKKQIVQA